MSQQQATASGTRYSIRDQAVHSAQEQVNPTISVQTQGANTQVEAAHHSPTIVVRNVPYDGAQITAMGAALAEARRQGEFPNTRIVLPNPEITIHDYHHLQRLRELRGDPNTWPRPAEYDQHFVEVTRIIQQRDAHIREQNHDAHVAGIVGTAIRGENEQADAYNLMRHAATNAFQQVISNAREQGVNMEAVLNELRTVVQNMTTQRTHGVDGVNMEAVLEEVFSMVESAMLDAAGPLRLNVNRIDGQVNRMGDQLGVMNNHVGTVGTHINRMGDQLGAMNNHVSSMNNHVSSMNNHVSSMNNHVSAVGTHVNALGALMRAVNNTVNATSGQMGHMSNQVQVLQNLIRIIPTLIEQAVREILPNAIQAALVPALIGSIQGKNFNGKGFGGNVDTFSAAVGKVERQSSGMIKNKKAKKNGLIRRFCGGFFKKAGRKDGGDGGSPPSMTH